MKGFEKKSKSIVKNEVAKPVVPVDYNQMKKIEQRQPVNYNKMEKNEKEFFQSNELQLTNKLSEDPAQFFLRDTDQFM